MGSASMLSAAARRIEGKVALITGAARGIGEATARLFFQHGAKVIIADIEDDLANSVCKDLDSKAASFIRCDVTKEKDVENAVNTAVSRYGKLDIMINNAGIMDEPKKSILDNDQAEFERVIGVNLVGAFLGTKHATRVMIPARRGSIINTASVCSTIGGVATHAYTSSKHGVLGLTRNAAVELGQFGIRVNCISPYVVVTSMAKRFLNKDEDGLRGLYSNLQGAILEPQDVAETALYLGSDESKCMSGHNILVDGGFTIVNSGFCMFSDKSN